VFITKLNLVLSLGHPLLIWSPGYAWYITFQVTQLLALYYCGYKTGRLTGTQLAIQSATKNTNKTRTSSLLSISLTLQPQKKSNQQPRPTKSISRRNNKKQNDQCKMLVNPTCPALSYLKDLLLICLVSY